MLLFDMLPSAELTEVCLSTAIGIDGWWTVAVTVRCTGIGTVPVAVVELLVAGIGYSMTVTVTAGMLLVVLLESSSAASGGLP